MAVDPFFKVNDDESFSLCCVDVHDVVFICSGKDTNVTGEHFLSQEMVSDIDVLSSAMVFCILGERNSTFIVVLEM